MFSTTDVVWAGDLYDSGKPQNIWNFRPVFCWLHHNTRPGQFICPNAFIPRTYSRTKDRIKSLRFLVVESDTLTKDEIGAVFNWCRQFMKLRAIVDTGGKSLHGWFNYPNQEVLDELKIILSALQCDPAMFNPSQPVRMPGASRGDKMQKLIWFEKLGE